MTSSESGRHRRLDRGMHYVSSDTLLRRLRYQLLIGALMCVFLPAVVFHGGKLGSLSADLATRSTIVICGVAFLIAMALFRRVISLPGIGVVAHVLPAVLGGYASAAAAIAILRLNYSGVVLSLSFVFSTIALFAFSQALRTARGRRFYVVPSPGIAKLSRSGGFEYHMLDRPQIPDDLGLILIGDLHDDLDDEWERLIADVAVKGYPVYHIKQIMESMTGQVQIDHLSENSFGSLIPNSTFHKTKRTVDLVGSLILLPLLVPIFIAVAIAVKLDSSGSVFFWQKRRGYRGEIFHIVKFRTMQSRDVVGDERQDATTMSDDDRITRLGRFLRRTRLDELPQVYNIVRGEMSWIGPRPEALPLSAWYAEEIPFYSYRHIVRPGITGWAQDRKSVV